MTRLIIDFNSTGEGGLLALAKDASGPLVIGGTVEMTDAEGNYAVGRVVSLEGELARIEVDWDSWQEEAFPEGFPKAARAGGSRKVVSSERVTRPVRKAFVLTKRNSFGREFSYGGAAFKAGSFEIPQPSDPWSRRRRKAATQKTGQAEVEKALR